MEEKKRKKRWIDYLMEIYACLLSVDFHIHLSLSLYPRDLLSKDWVIVWQMKLKWYFRFWLISLSSDNLLSIIAWEYLVEKKPNKIKSNANCHFFYYWIDIWLSRCQRMKVLTHPGFFRQIEVLMNVPFNRIH